MIRSGGTPRAMTCAISAWEAQSKPEPRAASTDRMPASGLHLHSGRGGPESLTQVVG